MVYLRTKFVSGKEYFYLIHSVRIEGKVKKIEKSIGTKKPSEKELEKLKEEFLVGINSKNWLVLTQEEYTKIEEIKKTKSEKLTNEQLMDFCVNFTYSTNAIEDNSLSKHETRELLENDKSVDKPFKDQVESVAHKNVFMEMVNCKEDLSVDLIKKWHYDLFNFSKKELAGKYRDRNVRVAQFKAPHYLDLSFLMNDFVKWFKISSRGSASLHPVELAALTHLKFVKIHPFLDGNGRIGRLLLNFVLHKFGYPMMTVEYKDRYSYYKALDEFDETQEEEIFVRYIVNSYLKEYEI
ncbi:MAG: Fic family protein, partial [Candidatus Woesearchaeota archaeon]